MKAWVIGSQGLLGRTLFSLFQEKGVEVVGTSSREADITQLDRLLEVGRGIVPTHLFNCAAYTDVDRAETERDLAFLVNVLGAGNVAKCATALNARCVHVSTDYLFSGEKEEGYREGDPCSPVNFYGWTKWKGELEVLEHAPQACVVRTSWVFGKGGKGFLSQLLRNLKEQRELRVIADQYSRPTYCPDLAEALFSLKEERGVIHFANREAGSRYLFADKLLSFLKKRGIPVTCEAVLPMQSPPLSPLAPRPKFSILETALFERVTQWSPRGWEEIFNDWVDDETFS